MIISRNTIFLLSKCKEQKYGGIKVESYSIVLILVSVDAKN